MYVSYQVVGNFFTIANPHSIHKFSTKKNKFRIIVRLSLFKITFIKLPTVVSPARLAIAHCCLRHQLKTKCTFDSLKNSSIFHKVICDKRVLSHYTY